MEKYRILETIASTVNSDVFLVTNTEDRRIYIMKKLKQGQADAYENAKGIQNPHIVKIHEVYSDTVILEYVSGISLSALNRCAAEYEVKEWTLQLCEGLAELHKNGIIHRDIKPSNVMLTDDGIIKLIDFDIARTHKEYRRKDTHCIGTEGYAPPEQYGFAQTDERSDIYSVGAMMFELLTNGRPLKELAGYNGLLKPIIEKCTKLSPDERYGSVAELYRALDGNSETANVQAPHSAAAQSSYFPKKVLGLIFAVAVLIISAAAALGFLLGKSTDTGNASPPTPVSISYGEFNDTSTPVGISSLRLEEDDPFLRVYVKLTDNQGFSEYTYVTLTFELLDSSGITLGYADVYGSFSAGSSNVSDGTIYAHIQKDGSYSYASGTLSTIRLSEVKLR
ncbi:MAG: serine/threonine-protein kinase [Clostridiales bacterium]|nr:serine/threonine-protein kinase [Clostridiales bacterium]